MQNTQIHIKTNARQPNNWQVKGQMYTIQNRQINKNNQTLGKWQNENTKYNSKLNKMKLNAKHTNTLLNPNEML